MRVAVLVICPSRQGKNFGNSYLNLPAVFSSVGSLLRFSSAPLLPFTPSPLLPYTPTPLPTSRVFYLVIG